MPPKRKSKSTASQKKSKNTKKAKIYFKIHILTTISMMKWKLKKGAGVIYNKLAESVEEILSILNN